MSSRARCGARGDCAVAPDQQETVELPTVTLKRSGWHPWSALLVDARKGGVTIPNGRPGVYEVKRGDSEERLHIGLASDLRMCVRQGLIKGKVPHSTGDRIREREDLTSLLVRWAETDRPAAIEEELHRRCKARYGRLPHYTVRT